MLEREISLHEKVLRGRNQVLQDLARGASLESVLTSLTRSAEECFPDLRCSILLLDGKRQLRHGAAPSLPDSYVRAIDGLDIGPDVGSCGAAAALGRRVVVDDVLAHSNWAPFRELAVSAKIRACWSEPIFSQDGGVLGTFAMYYGEPRKPSEDELEFIATTAHVAGIAIERKRDEDRRRANEERFRQLAESIHEVFYLTDWDQNRILYVSPAYETIWGRSCQSLYDDPKSWSYDIHPEDRARTFDAFVRDATRGGFNVEYRIIRPDGSVRWIHDRAFPIRDKHDRVYRIAGISDDITARKTVELEIEALRRTQVESLASELLLAEERERRRLALDLHDGLNQRSRSRA